MNQTPKANRLHIGIFGRTNAGKSSLLNYLAGQEVAITSPVPGTTTDVVEKTMELLPLGPVVFLDTAGLDDVSTLAEQRLRKTRAVFRRTDVLLLVLEPEKWGTPEDEVVSEAAAHNIPVIAVINKTDALTLSPSFLSLVNEKAGRSVSLSCLNTTGRETAVAELKKHLISVCPEEFLSPPPIVGDLLPAGGMVVLVVPIDLQAPKGRLILPQVQTLRDVLDHDATSLVVKEREYAASLRNLVRPPDLVVCDSQVVLKVTADTPASIRCTTFSTLFARAKGDLTEMARGAAVLNRLRPGDRILVAEACSHHPLEDDIGRVKIPRWITRHVGGELTIDVCSGKDFPDNLRDYRLVVHCGGCMLTRREMLSRIQCCRQAGVPITNYGVAISVMHGVAERVLAPFPSAREVFHHEQDKP